MTPLRMPRITPPIVASLILLLAACSDSTGPTPPGENTAPVAQAGGDQQACVALTIQLDGSGSSDADGDPLTYAWAFLSQPTGSNATLTGPTTATAAFIPDLGGTYLVALQVSDGTDTAQDTTEITAISNQITADIATDTTFTAACPVYHIDRLLIVDAKLTIEPGVTFEFASGQNRRLLIDTDGSIHAVGTATDTIRFVSSDTVAGAWEGIEIRSDSVTNLLSYVEVAYGGRNVGVYNIYVNNAGATVGVTNSLIHRSGTYGMHVDRDAILTAFGSNTFRNNTEAGLRLPMEQVGQLDTASRYGEGNGINMIEINTGTVTTAQTWLATDVPYLVDENLILETDVTIAPGAEFRFEAGSNSGIIVNAAGSLRAIGTTSDTIRFLAADSTDAWGGIEIRADDATNQLSYVEVAFAGAGAHQGNVDVRGTIDVNNSLIRNGLDYGIYVYNGGSLTASNNTYVGNASGDVRLP